MFDKLLIANRGEIACRVIRTARRLGVPTVALYSDADRDALHVRMADEAVHVGPPPSTESYLRTETIVAACRRTGADAVHPGYGFLSENPAFAGALEAAGVTFVGPPAQAIEAMGDKITSKRIAGQAGVSTIPGHPDVIDDADQAVAVARDVGYPVMLKASAGGGGKAMRVAGDDAQCRDAFERARSEARSSFGDERVFIEKFIEEPRHIEIQVLADKQGNVVHLGERECSIQRRHQKVIEEAPSPALDETTRRAMGEQAVALARAVEYCSAGTVEFIVDADRNFYFLEMNTRLQVEHPVTEMVTGLDLVEWMLRIAAGEALDLRQEDVPLRGWAVESRVYAEDPFRNFLPSIGRIVRYHAPEEGRHVRVDSGVYEGGEVSMYYDPMIAKVVTWADTREQAIAHMRDALDAFFIQGVSHNVSFLQGVMGHPRFQAGDLSTHFIAREYPEGFHAADVEHPEPALLIATAAVIEQRRAERAARIDGQMRGHRAAPHGDWVVVIGQSRHPVSVTHIDGGYAVELDGTTYTVIDRWRFGEALFRARIDERDVCIQVQREGIGHRLMHRGSQIRALVLTPLAAELERHMIEKPPADLSRYLLSPMPGLLVQLAVEAGQEVKAGEALAIVEAMKMENVLRASRDGTVAAVLAAPGDSLVVDQPILEFT